MLRFKFSGGGLWSCETWCVSRWTGDIALCLWSCDAAVCNVMHHHSCSAREIFQYSSRQLAHSSCAHVVNTQAGKAWHEPSTFVLPGFFLLTMLQTNAFSWQMPRRCLQIDVCTVCVDVSASVCASNTLYVAVFM